MPARTLAILLATTVAAFGQTAKPVLTPAERQKREDEARELNREAVRLTNAGRAADAIPLFEKVTATFRELYPDTADRNGRLYLAANLYNLGIVHYRAGNHPRAVECLEEALAVRRQLFPKDKYPNGDQVLFGNMNALAFIYESAGEFRKALAYCEESLAMTSALYRDHKDGHLEVALAHSQVGSVYAALGDLPRAREHLERALAMMRKVVPPDHREGRRQMADVLTDLALTLRQAHEYDAALARFEERLEVVRGTVPKAEQEAGHPDIGMALAQIGETLAMKGDFAKARGPLDEAMRIFTAVYPPAKYPAGHQNLAACTAIYGRMLYKAGDRAAARDRFARAVAMTRKLYPPDRFPDGHAYLAVRLAELGECQHVLGQSADALATFAEAIEIRRKQAERELSTAPEANALLLASIRARLVELYLSAARAVPGSDARAYAAVWEAKAAVMRVLQRRQQAARVALADRAVRDQWARLQETSRRISGLLVAPAADPKSRDAELRELTERKDRLERELAARVPGLRRPADSTPAALAQALPPGAAFIDLYRYPPISADGKAGPAYAAFVLVPGKDPIRVELEGGSAIEAAVGEWLAAIDRRADGAHGAKLAEAVWRPLARHLPAGTTTVYVSPDGDLSRLPWAAMPGPHGILVEDHAFALVPHGPFLLADLRARPRPAGEKAACLTVGGADYGPGAYPFLPGTAAEVRAVAALAGDRPTLALTGADATAARVLDQLPKARYAHLATHGYFAGTDLAAERRRATEYVRDSAARPGGRAGLGLRSPLSYTGLVFAGANRDPAAGVVTGEVLVTLPLDDLRLCVLSACETGLGEQTGGEGVFGLARAFHLAGCPNVVASLWKVNDAATAALMAKFYHGLWVEKKPPAEALRAAQLTVYRHPELISDLAGERGAPKLKEAVAGTAPAAAGPARRAAPAKLWAGFVLSGAGR